MRSQATQREQFYNRGGDFTPSNYEPDFTMDGTAQSAAIASGASRLRVNNQGGTGEHIRIAFGATAAEAEENLTITTGAATTGHFIAANSNGNGTVSEDIGIPANAGFYAIANAVAGDTQAVSVTQGV